MSQKEEKLTTKPPRHGPNRGTGEKPKNLKKSASNLYLHIKKYIPLIIIAVTFSSISSIFSIIYPDKLSDLANTIMEGITGKMDMEKVIIISITLGCIFVFSALFNFIEGFIMSTVSNKFTYELRDAISNKINTLPLKFFDDHLVGDILSIVTNDVDTVGQTLSQSIGNLVSSITLFIGCIIMMFITNVTLASVSIVSAVIGFFFVSIILKKSQKYFDERQKQLGLLNAHIEEIYSSIQVVDAYNGKDKEKEKFNNNNKLVYDANLKSQFLGGIMQPLMGFIGNLGYVAVCIVGSIMVTKGSISFGVIVAFMIYVKLFTSPLSQIAQSITSLQSTLAASERVFDLLEEKEMSDESKITGNLDIKDVKGNIEFEHVKFGYNKDKEIIHDFNLKVKQGQKIAIVGPTGAGKTTLVNLLMKFYNIDSGKIKIDGVDTKNLTRENIHNLFIMVLQDTWLFNGTIRDNIKYNTNATDEEIMSALKTVGISKFVNSLPNGLYYELTDSDSVSQGQKQLLTIARGMIKNSPFLILDEATSSVDTRTEEQVQIAMDKLTKNRTSFIIAHRLSTIKNADLILVLNEGDIIEQGTHDELIKKNGFYADLYNSQFQK